MQSIKLLDCFAEPQPIFFAKIVQTHKNVRPLNSFLIPFEYY